MKRDVIFYQMCRSVNLFFFRSIISLFIYLMYTIRKQQACVHPRDRCDMRLFLIHLNTDYRLSQNRSISAMCRMGRWSVWSWFD